MSASGARLTYTTTEIQGFLPSGWSIRSGAAGRWNADKKSWGIEVQDSADNVWPLAVSHREADTNGRLGALRASVGKLYRNALA